MENSPILKSEEENLNSPTIQLSDIVGLAIEAFWIALSIFAIVSTIILVYSFFDQGKFLSRLLIP